MSDLVFSLGMDVSQFTKSISEVENELKILRESLKTATGQGIVETNVKIKQLEQSLVDLKRVGLDQLPKGTANATNALSSLGNVARDLPFGFVAIQNNLPLVVDSFGQLTKQAGGLGPALKSIGSALIGPAGVSFAFGAVIAGVTALIQKYGSLGEAFDAIIGISPKLTESQKEFNKAVSEASGNVAVEEAKIKILVGTLTSLDQPQQSRIAAYNELKKISPDVVAGIRDENALTAASIDLISKNAEARLALLKLKIQEAGITAVLTKNAETLATKQQELNLASQEYVKNTANLTKAQGQNNITGLAAVQVQNNAFNAFKSSAGEVSRLQKEISDLNSVQDGYLKQLQPIVTQTAAINSATTQRVEGLKKENAAIKGAESARKKAIAEAIKKQKEFSKELEDENRAIEKGEDAFNRLILLRDKFTKGTDFGKKLTESKKVFDKFRKDNVEVDTTKKGPVFYPSQTLIDEQNRIKKLQDTFAAVKGNLETVFFSPLTDLFGTFFETGKFAFAEFGKSILKVIGQVVAKIIATGIINLLANILLPGAGVAAGAAKGIGGAFSSAIGSVLGIGGVTNPSFAGVGAGEMGMSGQVNVVLRGQDLVGALNRTNSTINRVG